MFQKFGTCLVKDSFCYAGSTKLRKFQSCVRKLAAYSTAEVSNEAVTSSSSNEDDWRKKIIYNEVLYVERKKERIRVSTERFIQLDLLAKSPKAVSVKSLFLPCIKDNKPEESGREDDTSSTIQFPYDIQKKVLVESSNPDEEVNVDKEDDGNLLESAGTDRKITRNKKVNVKFENPSKWQDDLAADVIDNSQFGSCDPNIPVSRVPCGGCGALLHCRDTAIPGFLPKEIYQNLSEAELRGITCQRCVFLEEYNLALGINVNPDEYPEILRKIYSKKALVILVIDLFDFPSSIWPDITQVIGKNKPLVVVGNKIDLLIRDKEKNFINHVQKCLIDTLEDIGVSSANIKHVALISAKTGYGVESLITRLYNIWETQGDIYIAGCTNVGKSTLFNTLIQSDFCKSKASDVLQRATVSQWPGTTLNLLKFPILKALGWRRVVRTERLKITEKQMKELRELQTKALQNSPGHVQTSLIGYIGKSFRKGEPSESIGLDPKDPEFVNSKWCYDTPGVVHESQILNLFTTDELAKVLPKKAVIPRNFKVIQGNALFIGGIARLDVVKSATPIWFTVFASADLPITVTYIEDADFIYEKLLGTKEFAVPEGSEERLKMWPKLKSKHIKVNGMYDNVASADVVLSSAGWISITLPAIRSCELCAWTPDRRGIFVRNIPLIRYGMHYRGKKMRGTPAYYPSLEVVEDLEIIE